MRLNNCPFFFPFRVICLKFSTTYFLMVKHESWLLITWQLWSTTMWRKLRCRYFFKLFNSTFFVLKFVFVEKPHYENCRSSFLSHCSPCSRRMTSWCRQMASCLMFYGCYNSLAWRLSWRRWTPTTFSIRGVASPSVWKRLASKPPWRSSKAGWLICVSRSKLNHLNAKFSKKVRGKSINTKREKKNQ